MRAFEESLGRHRRQNPGKLAHLGDVALPEERALVGVETAGEKVECYSPAVCPERLRVIDRRERVVIGDEIKGFALRLKRDGRPHHPEIIPDMKNAGGLNAGKNAHERSAVFNV